MTFRALVILLISTGVLLHTGCSNSTHRQIANLSNNPIVIALTSDQTLYEVIEIQPDVIRIEIETPDSGDMIHAYILGRNVHETIKPNIAITGQKGPGYQGRIAVVQEDGIVVSVTGNGFVAGSTIPPSLLPDIKERLGNRESHRLPTTQIVYKDRFISELTQDAQGNLIPPNRTKYEEEFLQTVVPAILDKNISALASRIHKRPDDSSNINTVLNFLETILGYEMQLYSFYRVDQHHPDNEFLQTHEYSLPIGWILRLHFKSPDDTKMNANLLIGKGQDILLFPTKYGRTEK